MADYALLGSKWGTSSAAGTSGGTVTWSFAAMVGTAYSFDAVITGAFQGAVRAAFERWESFADIDFVEIVDSSSNDIRLGWDTFDGSSGTLGEATTYFSSSNLIQRAEIAFDIAENWAASMGAIGQTSLFAVALHEIGHTIGFRHNDDPTSIMYPFLKTGDLHPVDIAEVQSLYGVSPNYFAGSISSDQIFANDNPNTVFGNAGNDTIFSGAGNDTVYAGDGNDIAYGGFGNDQVYGGSGQDTVGGGVGDDSVGGGSGDDLVFGGEGQDMVFGDDGGDNLQGGTGRDTMIAGAGNDSIYGSDGDDVAYGAQGLDVEFGGAGADTLFGGEEADTLWGGAGNDHLWGGTGADRFAFGTGSGNDEIFGFSRAERDVIDLQGQSYTVGSGAGGEIVLTLSGGGTITLDGVTSVSNDMFV